MAIYAQIASAVGGTVAGPAGLIIGSIAGTLIEHVCGENIMSNEIVSTLLNKHGEDVVRHVWKAWQKPEYTAVNHDLQRAFRDAFQEAVCDIGGKSCFPKQWKQNRRAVPKEILFSVHNKEEALAEQTREFFVTMYKSVDKLLPLEAEINAMNAVNPYLEADDPQALNLLFMEMVFTPLASQNRLLLEAVPQLKDHVQQHLLRRTLVHLGENLKERDKAWRAFNRLFLESINQQLDQAAADHHEIKSQLSDIQTLITTPQNANALADIISQIGGSQAETTEQLDDLLDILFAQYEELNDFIVAQHVQTRQAILETESRLSATLDTVAKMADIAEISTELSELKAILQGRETAVSPTPPPKTKAQPRQAYEPELCVVPSGSFIMGADTPSTPDYERQHIVDLPTYAISRYPITNALYAAFVKKTNHPRPSDWRGGRMPSGKEDFPVVYVSWHDARVYCQWLSEQTNKLYRLPTEAEWEKAARGEEGLLYPWGNEWQDTVCNCGGGRLTAVNLYPAGKSIYGCEDMLGNTREWTSTLWGADYRTPQYPYPYQLDDREDNETSDYTLRVTRSSSFQDKQSQTESALRRCYAPTNKNAYRGFRVVLTLDSLPAKY